jgi:hypothetical protein
MSNLQRRGAQEACPCHIRPWPGSAADARLSLANDGRPQNDGGQIAGRATYRTEMPISPSPITPFPRSQRRRQAREHGPTDVASQLWAAELTEAEWERLERALMVDLDLRGEFESVLAGLCSELRRSFVEPFGQELERVSPAAALPALRSVIPTARDSQSAATQRRRAV